jgi:hypothetical protein
MNNELKPLIDFMTQHLENVKKLNSTFKPKYGARVIEKLYNIVMSELICNRMNESFLDDTEDEFL